MPVIEYVLRLRCLTTALSKTGPGGIQVERKLSLHESVIHKMELFIDIADLDEVRSIAKIFPIDGFTTNPVILTRSGKGVSELMREYRDYVSESGKKVFVQVTADDADGMISQARAIHAFFGGYAVVKLPATEAGYEACMTCRAEGIAVCITVVHSTLQGLMAAKAGADYVAPYVSHIDNIGADGIGCVEEMVTIFRNSGYGTKVLGASFRTADQILRLALVGCHAVTVTPDMARMLIKHPSTDVSLEGFGKAWKEHFGEKQISDFLK